MYMKRILCTLLSLLILLSACPISAYAQVIEEELSDGIVYTVNSKTGEVIIKGNGEIPDYSTSPFLFLNGDIKFVLIESGISKISARLFRNCTSLEKISISDTVTQIDNTAFDGCTGIKEFYVAVDNVAYSSFDGVLYSKDLTKLIKFPPAKSAEEFVTLKNTETICKNSFKYAQHLKKIVVSPETKNIEENFNKLNIQVDKQNSTPSTDEDEKHELIYRTVQPTCTNFGYIECFCKICNDSYIIKYICPTRHRLVETVTPATTESDGHKVKVCSVCGEVVKDEIINKISDSSLDYSSAEYNRYQFSPNVYIVDSNGKRLVCGTDYILNIPRGRRCVGMYNYDIAFIGNYSGMQRLPFFIYPQSPVFRKIILRKGNVEINWEKTASQCDGYEIMYSQYPSFINNQVVDVNNKNAKKIALQGLKSGEFYYFKIRSYKITNENDMIYSSWSNIGKAKII